MDKARAEIRDLLQQRGLTFAALDRRYGLSHSIAWKACTYPHTAGETAIAAAIGRDPASIWPSRYDRNGQRLSPQPRHYYTRLTGAEKRSARRAS